MASVEFNIDEFPDGRLMLLIVFREGKNFRVHRKNGETYYTWCPHEDDLDRARKCYEAIDGRNKKSKEKQSEDHKQDKKRDSEKDSGRKPFYT